MMQTILVAADEGDVIGQGPNIPWHLPADLKRFRQLTWGHTLVMGRKTFESIGRPLPGRETIVITRQPDYQPPGVRLADSLTTALAMAGETKQEIFIVGGGEIYRQAFSLAERLLLTRVHARLDGDVFFPPIDPATWERVWFEDHPADAQNPHPYTFEEYRRVNTR